MPRDKSFSSASSKLITSSSCQGRHGSRNAGSSQLTLVGSEQDGFRPVLILQNDTGNKFSPTTIVAPITSTKPASRMPTHVRVNVVGLVSGSVALLEQIRTIDKRRLDDYVGKLNKEMMGKVDHAIITSLGIKVMEGLLK